MIQKDAFGAEAMSDIDLLALAVMGVGAFVGLRFYWLTKNRLK